MRAAFFAVAATWGFLLGLIVFAMSHRHAGLEVAFDGTTATFVVPGLLVACAGGWVAAAAYRETRRRR